MKVLICTGIFPPEVGGPATYSKRLAEELTKRGHKVRVITYSKKKGLEIRDERLSITMIRRSWFKPWHYYKYYRAVLRLGAWADLIYAQGPISEGYPAYLANKKLKKPLVVKVVGDRSWEYAMQTGQTVELLDQFQNQKAYSKKIEKMRTIQSEVCRSADSVITPSEYLKKIVSGWGVSAEKIKVIHNSVEVPQIHSNKTSDFLIISSGRKVKWKGFDLLRKVADELSNSVELDTAVKLEVLQNLPRGEYLQRLARADLFVLNTSYEGFSHALLEAMALGIPVIATKVGGNIEVVNDGENGLLVEYNNRDQLKEAILKLLSDKKLRDELSKKASETARQFSFDKMVNKIESVLKFLIQNS